MQAELINQIATSMLQINRSLNEIKSHVDNICTQIRSVESKNTQKYDVLATELKTAYKVFESAQDKLQELYYETEEITDIEASNWHDIRPFILCKDKEGDAYFPKKEGEYICVIEETLADGFIKYRRHFEILNWSKDLFETDESFKDKEKVAGWWKWDTNLNKVEVNGIVAWTQLPHIRNNEPLV